MDPSLQEKETALARVPIFSRLPPRSLRKLARLCIHRRYPRGTAILEEGSPGLGLFLITAGRVEVTKRAGSREVPLAVLGDGEVLGEIALIDDRPRSATAFALEETACLLLTRERFRTLLRKHPKIAWPIVPSLAERVRDLQSKLIESEAGAVAPPAEEPGTRAAEPEIRAAEPEIRAAEPEIRAAEPQVEILAVREAEPSALAVTDNGGESPGDASLGVVFLRAQLGFFLSGAVGMSESARLMETFLRTFADETRLGDGRDLGELVADLPRGMLEASWKTLREGREVPGRMLDGLLRPFGKDRRRS